MIYFDVSKAAGSQHRSGLTRVSARLREELGGSVSPVVWREGWQDAGSNRFIELTSRDWLLTPELFSENERPGFWGFLTTRSCRIAAIFHDAIPLKFPQITWPQSVARHPEYLKMLSCFDHVFAVSEQSRKELIEFWRWQATERQASVETILLGADFARLERSTDEKKRSEQSMPPLLLCVGILEPRKNQGFLAEVAERLAGEGISFRLEIVGRVNPHFGKPIEQRLRMLNRRYPRIKYRGSVDDTELLSLWKQARASVFCTLAEGCGLPLLESLWMGVPCVCSDLPVLRENGSTGGCEFVRTNDHEAWTGALRRLLIDDCYAAELQKQVIRRVLPSWRQTAEQIKSRLES